MIKNAALFDENPIANRNIKSLLTQNPSSMEYMLEENNQLQYSYIDIEDFLSVTNILGDSHETILNTYIELSEDAIDEINDALINNEPKVLKGVIHSMKSSSYQIGATGLGDLAKKIELLITENNLKNIQPITEKFIDESHAVNTKIQQYIDSHYNS